MFNLDPETSVGFLLHDVSRLMRAWFDERAQALGLTRAQWRVLVHLGPRQGINQTSLAEILELDNVTLSRHIDRLERSGWLERRPDPEDRRAWRLYLSEASRPTLSKMETLAAEAQAVALADLSPDQRALFVETLVKIKENLAPKANDTDVVEANEARSQHADGNHEARTGA
ncbi:MAG: MarR family winged helix-turn-helix transcriptional regulator [Geminicoccaceae bacterium]